MTDPYTELAREIVMKFAVNEDTYLSYQSKPKDVIRAVAQALRSVRQAENEACAKVASEFAPKPIEETYFSEREHDFIRNKVECVVIAIRKLLEVKGA